MSRLAMFLLRPLAIVVAGFLLAPVPAHSQPAVSPSLQGYWLSEGYGLFFDLATSTLHSYQITSISCLPAREFHFVAQLDFSTLQFQSENSTLTLSSTNSSDVLRLHYSGTASEILLHRTEHRLAACDLSPPNTPQQNYAIFWQTFAENYPFFTLHSVDWRSVDRKFRPQVTSATTHNQLFDIFRQMLEPLHDTHTGLEAEDLHLEFDGYRPDPNHLDKAQWEKVLRMIETNYVHAPLHVFCGKHIQFGVLPNSLGYLRVTAFYGYAEGPYASQLACLDQALDTILTGPAKLKGLILDVRLNDGGDDPLGIAIASRLTGEKYLAWTKVARNSNDLDAPLQFTEPQASWVTPSPRPGFLGDVVLLTGPDTVSAGETFAMALMGRTPHITRIGANTQGVFSDVMNRYLPNGWHFRLPNEIYYTSDGQSFDGEGIPPDIRIPSFFGSDLSRSRDATLDAAIGFLLEIHKQTDPSPH